MGTVRQGFCYGAMVVAFCFPGMLVAAPPPNFGQVTIPRVGNPPQLEEFLTMKPSPMWEGKLAKIDNFIQRVPSDGEPVSQRTEAYLAFDDKNLYAIFICFDNDPKKVRARLSRREDIFDDDSIEVMLDTFHDHRRAYAFFSNALGVQADALWTEGQEWDFSFDTVFDSEARITPEGFVIKLAIPFRSLRFASNDPQTWGILLNRNILRNNESSFWPQYSSRVSGRLNQEGDATGLENISPGEPALRSPVSGKASIFSGKFQLLPDSYSSAVYAAHRRSAVGCALNGKRRALGSGHAGGR